MTSPVTNQAAAVFPANAPRPANITFVPGKDANTLHILGPANIAHIRDAGEFLGSGKEDRKSLVIDIFGNAFLTQARASTIIENLISNANKPKPDSVRVPARRETMSYVHEVHEKETRELKIPGSDAQLLQLADLPASPDALPGCIIRSAFEPGERSGILYINDPSHIVGITEVENDWLSAPSVKRTMGDDYTGIFTAVQFDNGQSVVLQHTVVETIRKLQESRNAFFFQPLHHGDYLRAIGETLNELEIAARTGLTTRSEAKPTPVA